MKIDNKMMITVSVSIQAPIEKVWEHWNEPKYITQWYNASDDWHAPFAENDLKVGGKFKTTMAAKDGSAAFDFEGTYTSIVKSKQIEYAIIDGRKVILKFYVKNNETVVEETFDPEEINSIELQRGGWQAILNNFKSHVEKSN